MKITIIADIHIKLGQKNVPTAWQSDRFKMLAEQVNKTNPTTIVIAGDLLDVADPSIEEIGLMYSFLKSLKCSHEIILIPGNHELTSKKNDCYSSIQEMLTDLGIKVISQFENYLGIDFIPYNVIKDEWPAPTSNICITHVRGEIPPHVKPEIDLSKLSAYKYVFAGDLHSHKNSQLNIIYPGSPMVTSFHRNRVSGSNGLIILDTETETYKWLELDLPQLIRKTVSSVEDMVPGDYDHIIYELEGSIEDLKSIEGNDLLDKKVVKGISTPATLNMTGNLLEEVQEYLSQILSIEDVSEYITLLEDIKGEQS